MWQNPLSAVAAAGGDTNSVDMKEVQESFDDFFEEVGSAHSSLAFAKSLSGGVPQIHDELVKHGKIEELNVCENLGDHMVGNVYVKFEDEENADSALKVSRDAPITPAGPKSTRTCRNRLSLDVFMRGVLSSSNFRRSRTSGKRDAVNLTSLIAPVAATATSCTSSATPSIQCR